MLIKKDNIYIISVNFYNHSDYIKNDITIIYYNLNEAIINRVDIVINHFYIFIIVY